MAKCVLYRSMYHHTGFSMREYVACLATSHCVFQ